MNIPKSPTKQNVVDSVLVTQTLGDRLRLLCTGVAKNEFYRLTPLFKLHFKG